MPRQAPAPVQRLQLTNRERRTVSCYLTQLELNAGQLQSIASSEHALNLSVVRRHVVKSSIEVTCQRPEILGEQVWIENLRKPPQADQAIDRWWEIDPAERQFGRQMNAPRADGRNRRPGSILDHACGEIPVDRDDHVRIPNQHLLNRNGREPAARAARDVLCQELDCFNID